MEDIPEEAEWIDTRGDFHGQETNAPPTPAILSEGNFCKICETKVPKDHCCNKKGIAIDCGYFISCLKVK